ncbi:excinuclease ABC subunit UvrC [Pseudomonadales bacterium]|jgi:excinuclease ABC subunit C|nr:excinuclease ABC subunit UvrC [Pseudomonadales bacterium]MDB2509190.1 excinuclease ABC subunit UvrC [Pseudomonadales bacterium]MDC1314463.1 excinuclease ABC subunit UvrC [Pseudomonadales bacterium]
MSFDASNFLKSLTTKPGVYRMLDEAGEVLYVGKAKNLKSRVSSYFQKTAKDSKTMALVAKICDVTVTVTSSETEALLLEQSQIKAWRPPYNIIFKDDKSYPYIYISTDDQYPRLAFHRGAQKKKGRYFGPFPSAYSVRDSLNVLEKAFLVRQCEDSYFKNRSRPCLQYQIKRCSGPCCDLISESAYRDDVNSAMKFLAGKSAEVMEDYRARMDAASENLEFERAASYRDQIQHLRKIQEQQYVVGAGGDIDVIHAELTNSGLCVLVMFIRNGRMLGNKTFYPSNRLDENAGAVLAAFLAQFYLDDATTLDLPGEIIVNQVLPEKSLLEAALTERRGRKVSLRDRVRGTRARWLEIASNTAKQSLGSHLAKRDNLDARFKSLQKALKLPAPPKRLECFDISHTQGEATVASCVVFNEGGPLKSDYRRFNIDNITPGDDYAAMDQALRRRYARIKKGEAPLPDLLLIDGGKGQLTQALRVMTELKITGVRIIGVAKGPTRKAGLESLIEIDGSELVLDANDPGLHLIQHIRDESHRFAITGHRARRGKSRTESQLDGIDGVGPTRRRNLLRYFGGVKQVLGASQEELSKVEGISQKLAEEIYGTLHR